MTSRREFLLQAAAAGVLSSRGPGMVETVLGPIEPATLGFTLTHEHICNCGPDFFAKWSGSFGGRVGLVARAVTALEALRKAGVETLVDLTPYDVGRDIRLLEEVSRKSGLRIIACTGQHLYPPAALAERSTEELTRVLIAEIEQGIDGTGIKAGVIKVATDQAGITPMVERALTAAARTSLATGAPIQTHTHARLRMGEKQAALFETQGVNPARVSLGHSDDTDDMAYLLGLARRGYTLGMDHVNRGLKPDAQVPWRKRAECIKSLINAGFEAQLFLSTDMVLGAAMLPPESQGEREKTNPDGMLFNTRQLLPHLREIGVTKRQIHAMTTDNPRRFYAK